MSSKDTFYFSHDYNAREDEKIKELIFEHGLEGYGIFWALIEMLYQNANALRTNYKRIAFELRTQEEKVSSIINDFCLFQISDDIFFSDSVQRRLNEREEKSKKARESANSRWNKKKENANALIEDCERNAIKENKGNENKGNNFLLKKETKEESTISKTVKFNPPTVEEVQSYCNERKNGIQAYKFVNFYQSKGWKVGNQPMKDWRAAVHTWESKDTAKPLSNISNESEKKLKRL